jgi:hypothetical protein
VRRPPPFLPVVLGLLGLAGGMGAAPRAVEAKEATVPKEADRVFDGVAAAFRKADATGVLTFMEPGDSGRVWLSLDSVASASYTHDHGVEALAKDYFPKRQVVSLKPGEDCTKGDDWSLSRVYVLTQKVGETQANVLLTVGITRRQVGETYAWYLTAVKERG